jgi:hypothetical protein
MELKRVTLAMWIIELQMFLAEKHSCLALYLPPCALRPDLFHYHTDHRNDIQAYDRKQQVVP